MGKYEPLTKFLRGQDRDDVPMTFRQIEQVIGGKLPASARHHRAYWSNNGDNSVLTKAWLEAGFRSARVNIAAEKVTFIRQPPTVLDEADQGRAAGRHGKPTRHPLIGAMKGTVWIAPGTDLTKPAMPEWGEVTYGNKTWDDFK